jgi:hypothetical protein
VFGCSMGHWLCRFAAGLNYGSIQSMRHRLLFVLPVLERTLLFRPSISEL